jgi:hypothetical protein
MKALSKVTDSIRCVLQKAVSYAEGKMTKSAYHVHVPKAIGTNLDMTQEKSWLIRVQHPHRAIGNRVRTIERENEVLARVFHILPFVSPIFGARWIRVPLLIILGA